MNDGRIGFVMQLAGRLMLAVQQRKPTVPEIMPLVWAYYTLPDDEQRHIYYSSGGSLHILLDDGNVENDHVSFCMDAAMAAKDEPGMIIAAMLQRMSRTQRLRVSKLAYHSRWKFDEMPPWMQRYWLIMGWPGVDV